MDWVKGMEYRKRTWVEAELGESGVREGWRFGWCMEVIDGYVSIAEVMLGADAYAISVMLKLLYNRVPKVKV